MSFSGNLTLVFILCQNRHESQRNLLHLSWGSILIADSQRLPSCYNWAAVVFFFFLGRQKPTPPPPPHPKKKKKKDCQQWFKTIWTIWLYSPQPSNIWKKKIYIYILVWRIKMLKQSNSSSITERILEVCCFFFKWLQS